MIKMNVDNQIRKIIAASLEIAEDSFRSDDDLILILGISSLAFAKIIANIEDYYDIYFELDDLVEKEKFTIQSFSDLVRKTVKNK